MWMNALQAMVDVIKYVLIILVHISAAVIRDTPQMGKDAEVHLCYPLPISQLPVQFFFPQIPFPVPQIPLQLKSLKSGQSESN